MLQAGIVGLPNVGKSTLFNAVTRTRKAQAANYPFCTIDPNVGMVTVPDPRLQVLSDMSGSEKIIPTLIEFVDIAGLVKGASEGAGLGNQFLANIREVDAIVQVVRCFDNDDIIHELGSVDPLRDIDIINSELILADIATMEKRLSSRERKARSGDKEAILLREGGKAAVIFRRPVHDAALLELLAVGAEGRRIDDPAARVEIAALHLPDRLRVLKHPLLGAALARVAALLQLGAGCAVKNQGKTDFHQFIPPSVNSSNAMPAAKASAKSCCPESSA